MIEFQIFFTPAYEQEKVFFICLFIFLIVRQSLHDSTCIVALACVSNVSIIVTTDEYKLVLCNKF